MKPVHKRIETDVMKLARVLGVPDLHRCTGFTLTCKQGEFPMLTADYYVEEVEERHVPFDLDAMCADAVKRLGEGIVRSANTHRWEITRAFQDARYSFGIDSRGTYDHHGLRYTPIWGAEVVVAVGGGGSGCRP